MTIEFAFTLLLMTMTAVADDDATKAQAILTSRCSHCHADGNNEGGFDFILNVNKLVERQKLVPGKAKDSRIIQLIRSGKMPKDEEPLPAEEIAALEKWIQAGAKPFPTPPAANRPLLADVDLYRAMHRHLSSLHPTVAKNQRFFSLLPQHNNNQDVSDAEMRLYRAGVAKLLNSLSWKRAFVQPKLIDEHAALLAIDVRDLDWDQRDQWNRIVAKRPEASKADAHSGYVYGLLHNRYPESDELNRLAEQVYQLAGTKLPAIRADWFLANASRPPLYHELLNLPTNCRDLERTLKVDIPADFLRDRVMRVGLTTSNVSASANRLVDLHESVYGIYMKSRDFRSNEDRGDIVRFPNGPLNLFPEGKHPFADTAYVHDGGEIIGTLPNGLHFYVLTDGKDDRINVGPTDVVRDPREFAGRGPAIVNGISCFGCHTQGVIRDGMIDQVRNSNALQGPARDKMRRTYVEQDLIDKRLEDAQKDYLRSLSAVMTPWLKTEKEPEVDVSTVLEPITTLASPYLRGNLTLEEAAFDLGVTPESLKTKIEAIPQLGEFGLGPLANGGKIKRAVWESVSTGTSVFQEVAGILRRGAPYQISGQ